MFEFNVAYLTLEEENKRFILLRIKCCSAEATAGYTKWVTQAQTCTAAVLKVHQRGFKDHTSDFFKLSEIEEIKTVKNGTAE